MLYYIEQFERQIMSKYKKQIHQNTTLALLQDMQLNGHKADERKVKLLYKLKKFD